jgi:hypothetical protein
MPRIHILQAIAGPDFSWNADSVVDVSGEEASKWCDGIRAELVRGETVETPESKAARPARAAKNTKES